MDISGFYHTEIFFALKGAGRSELFKEAKEPVKPKLYRLFFLKAKR